jgi:antitoxin component YwqK of YwqJK toxin-antitoxin module
MFIQYFEDGFSIHRRGYILNGKQEGLWEEYYEEPYFMKTLNRFRGGLPDGTQIYWHTNGGLQSIIQYKEGHLHGDIRIYDTERKLLFRGEYCEGICVKIDVDRLSTPQLPSTHNATLSL